MQTTTIVHHGFQVTKLRKNIKLYNMCEDLSKE